jgi:hypothetical protein
MSMRTIDNGTLLLLGNIAGSALLGIGIIDAFWSRAERIRSAGRWFGLL